MQPKEDPETLALRANPKPVKRLSRRAIALVIGVLVVGVLGALTWGLQRKPAPLMEQSPAVPNVERVPRTETLESLPRDYGAVPRPPQLGAPLGELGKPVLRAEQEAGLPPMPERPTFRPDPAEDAARSARLNREREAESAATATVFANLRGRRVQKADAGSGESSQAAQTVAPPATALARGLDDPAPQTGQEPKQAFVDRAGEARIYGSGTLHTPRSPWQLMAGSVIPAALVTGINSDLPGQVIATVTEPVYDSVSGAQVLIPQGTRLLGQYDSQVAYGQRRVLLVWTRLVMPDGSSITLDRLPGVDLAGNAGLEDGVDWHWDRILAGAALSTLLGVGAELAAPDRRGDGDQVVIAARQSVQETVNQVGQEMTKRNLDIQPTLTIRPGFPVRVIVNRDLVLRPYGIGARSKEQTKQ